MKQRAPYKLEESLGHHSGRFHRAILRRINAELAKSGFPITSEQFSFLVQIWDESGQPQGALTEKTGKDKTTIARLAAGVESLGLIVRLPAPGDGREKLVQLTEKGKVMMDEVTGLVQGILAEAQKGIAEEDLQVCKEVLRKACRNLG